MSRRRSVLVTGASRGIGAAIATALASSGDAVAVHCRHDRQEAESVVAGLAGSGHAVVTGDIADPAGSRSVVAGAVAALGRIDLLVNNAGVYEETPIVTTSYEDWQKAWSRAVSANLLGTANITWCVVDPLLRRAEGPDGGRIITVGSRGAYRGEPDAPAYGATKAAVHSLTQSLAVALATHGIGVAAVAPSFVNTETAKALLAGPGGDAVRAQSPFGRVAEPEEVATAVVWLASPAAEWASGSVLDLNGASYLR